MLESVGLGQMVPEGIQSRQQGCLVRRAGAGRSEVHKPREQRDLGTRGGLVPGVEPEWGPEFEGSPVMR